MEGVLTGIGLVVSCGVGLFVGWGMAFAAVRAAGFRLLYENHHWVVKRPPSRTQPPGTTPTGTMRSLN